MDPVQGRRRCKTVCDSGGFKYIENCKAIVKDINGKEYSSKEIFEKAYEPYFNVFEKENQEITKRAFNWIKNFLGKDNK